MADVKMPESIPCRFDAKGWAPCKKPSTNGWCSKHENLKCVSCGKQAVRSCDVQMGGLACGSALCDECRHLPSVHGPLHITKEVAKERQRKEHEEKTARVASRTSPEQRMNKKLGVPLTLAELLKGDWRKEYELTCVYYLELSHGLMGFFPAVFAADYHRIVFVTDLRLLECVWQKLEPREAHLRREIAYVSEKRGIAYIDTKYAADREDREPCKLLTATEFESLSDAKECAFSWAPGLIGARYFDRQQFLQLLKRRAIEFDPSFKSAMA